MPNLILSLQLVALTHATVIDISTGTANRDQTIIVDGRRIAAVGPAATTPTPAHARVMDLRGRFVIPGLWDMHVHNDVPGGGALLALYVVHGVTGVRDMNGALENLRRWQREISAGTRAGPRMFASGPYIVGARVPVPHVEVHTVAEAVIAVDALATLGVDFIKVHTALSADAFFTVAREARRKGIPFAGHVMAPVTPLQASDSGLRSAEHLSGFPNECTSNDSTTFARAIPLQRLLLGGCTSEPQAPIYEHIARNGMWITPTLTVQMPLSELQVPAQPGSLSASYYSDSLLFMMREHMGLPSSRPAAARKAGRAMFAKRVAMVGTMHRSGIAILAGTDAPIAPSPPGVALHDELELLVRAGLTPLEALHAATIEPARYFAATDSLGSVAAGKLADLVVLDADPLRDIRNVRRIHMVVADGRIYDAEARSVLLDGVKQAARGRSKASPRIHADSSGQRADQKH
jgi:Amidohydrolase family